MLLPAFNDARAPTPGVIRPPAARGGGYWKRGDRPRSCPRRRAGAEGVAPAFTDAAVRAGVRAVFMFPLQVGAVRLGPLNLYRDTPGPLRGEQRADILAAVITAGG